MPSPSLCRPFPLRKSKRTLERPRGDIQQGTDNGYFHHRLLIIFMFMVPESPRWTATQDDWESTTKILCKLRG